MSQIDEGRRNYLKTSAAVAAGSLTGLSGCIGDLTGDDSGYPHDTVRVIVPFGEGGGTDTNARNLLPAAGDILGVNFQIDNVPGAASLRGVGEAYNAEPDGSTILFFNAPSTPTSWLVNPQDWELTEFEGLATYGLTPFGVWANPDADIDGFEDLIAKYNSGEFTNFGGQGRGGYVHVQALVMRNMDEYNLAFENYIGYDGSGPTIQAIASGEVPAGVASAIAASGPVADGRVEPLAILASGGSPAMPDVPSVTDLGYPNMDWIGVSTNCAWGPPGLSDDLVQTLNETIGEATESDAFQSYAEESGLTVNFGSPSDAEQVLEDALSRIQENVDLEELSG